MDEGFGRIDYRQDRQDGAIRYMMGRMSMNVPDFFHPTIDPQRYPPTGFGYGFDPSMAGGSSQPGGSGSGSGYGGGYVDPTPEFQVFGEEEEESDEE